QDARLLLIGTRPDESPGLFVTWVPAAGVVINFSDLGTTLTEGIVGDPTTEYAIWLSLDVGKSNHHACALTSTAERVYDSELHQDEAALRQVITGLQEYGPVLVVVDQPNTIGALPVAVARDCGADVAYLPGLAMRKAADLYP